jgi:DNA-binding PadR family transcriptional regulator
MSSPSARLTTPDLVLLGLFTERDWHGYELNAELGRRHVTEWAGVSRPQVYYSLRKLSEQGLIAPLDALPDGPGPERQTYCITERGRQALAEGLAREEWTTQHVPPPFLTWFALSPYAPRPTVERMITLRADYLQTQISRENQHLAIIRGYEGVTVQAADLMVAYKISQYESEVQWLKEVRQALFDDPDPQ